MLQKKVILLLATYGIVQVLAQDLGIPSGDKQVKLIQTQPVEAAILYAGGYTVSEDHNICRTVHSLQEAVFTIIYTIKNRGTIIKITEPTILNNISSRIDERRLFFCKYKFS